MRILTIFSKYLLFSLWSLVERQHFKVDLTRTSAKTGDVSLTEQTRTEHFTCALPSHGI